MKIVASALNLILVPVLFFSLPGRSAVDKSAALPKATAQTTASVANAISTAASLPNATAHTTSSVATVLTQIAAKHGSSPQLTQIMASATTQIASMKGLDAPKMQNMMTSLSMINAQTGVKPQTLINITNIITNITAKANSAITQPLAGLLSTIGTMSTKLSPQGLSNLTNLVSILSDKLTPQSTKALTNFIKTLDNMGLDKTGQNILNKFANNLNKLDQLQMLLIKYPELSTQDLLNMLGPFAKAALGEDDELTAEEKAEQKQAANNIIEFFENISKGQAYAIMKSLEHRQQIKEQKEKDDLLRKSSRRFKEFDQFETDNQTPILVS